MPTSPAAIVGPKDPANSGSRIVARPIVHPTPQKMHHLSDGSSTATTSTVGLPTTPARHGATTTPPSTEPAPQDRWRLGVGMSTPNRIPNSIRPYRPLRAQHGIGPEAIRFCRCRPRDLSASVVSLGVPNDCTVVPGGPEHDHGLPATGSPLDSGRAPVGEADNLCPGGHGGVAGCGHRQCTVGCSEFEAGVQVVAGK